MFREGFKGFIIRVERFRVLGVRYTYYISTVHMNIYIYICRYISINIYSILAYTDAIHKFTIP